MFMKKIRSIIKPYMIRPLVYQSVTKLVTALVICLLWDRTLNQSLHYDLAGSAFFTAGILFFMLAWFQYLRLDGVCAPLMRGEKKRKTKTHVTKDIVDFADEKIISFGELADEEQMVCRLLGDLLCGGIYLLASLTAYL